MSGFRHPPEATISTSIPRVIAALVAVLIFSPEIATSQAIRAPYQIDVIERTAERHDTSETRVVVGLGRARDPGDSETGVSPPDDDALDWMTVLGSRGFVFASRERTERRCEHLCGDELEECHWVGLYAPEGPLESIGVPIATLPGRLDLADYLGSVQLQSSSAPLASLAASDTAVALLWGPWPEAETQVKVTRWEATTGAFAGAVRSGSATSPLTAEQCESKPRDWLLEIDCGSFAVLASGDRPLLLSWADYNLAAAEPLARFVYHGSRHYVIRFGAKAQDVVGLVSAEPAGWRARFRPRDWALIC